MADWINDDPRWQAMAPDQKAAAMALLETGAENPTDAIHVAGAMVNRAQAEKKDLGQHVGTGIYQPSFDAKAKERFDGVVSSPYMEVVSDWVRRRQSGEYQDPVNGATHFLMPPKAMVKLENDNPSLYKDWGPRGSNWTGYDPQANPDMYGYEVFADKSHRFLTPKEHGGTLAQDPERVAFNPQSPPNYGGSTPASTAGADRGPLPGGPIAQQAVAGPAQTRGARPGSMVDGAQRLFGAGDANTTAPNQASLFGGLQSLFGSSGESGGGTAATGDAAANAMREKNTAAAKTLLAKTMESAAHASPAPAAPHQIHTDFGALQKKFGGGYLNQDVFSLSSLFGAPRQKQG
jgi:hypothetical protein